MTNEQKLRLLNAQIDEVGGMQLKALDKAEECRKAIERAIERLERQKEELLKGRQDRARQGLRVVEAEEG